MMIQILIRHLQKSLSLWLIDKMKPPTKLFQKNSLRYYILYINYKRFRFLYYIILYYIIYYIILYHIILYYIISYYIILYYIYYIIYIILYIILYRLLNNILYYFILYYILHTILYTILYIILHINNEVHILYESSVLGQNIISKDKDCSGSMLRLF